MKTRLDTRKEKTRTSGGCSCATHQPSPPLPKPSDHHRGGLKPVPAQRVKYSRHAFLVAERASNSGRVRAQPSVRRDTVGWRHFSQLYR